MEDPLPAILKPAPRAPPHPRPPGPPNFFFLDSGRCLVSSRKKANSGCRLILFFYFQGRESCGGGFSHSPQSLVPPGQPHALSGQYHYLLSLPDRPTLPSGLSLASSVVASCLTTKAHFFKCYKHIISYVLPPLIQGLDILCKSFIIKELACSSNHHDDAFQSLHPVQTIYNNIYVFSPYDRETVLLVRICFS